MISQEPFPSFVLHVKQPCLVVRMHTPFPPPDGHKENVRSNRNTHTLTLRLKDQVRIVQETQKVSGMVGGYHPVPTGDTCGKTGTRRFLNNSDGVSLIAR